MSLKVVEIQKIFKNLKAGLMMKQSGNSVNYNSKVGGSVSPEEKVKLRPQRITREDLSSDDEDDEGDDEDDEGDEVSVSPAKEKKKDYGELLKDNLDKVEDEKLKKENDVTEILVNLYRMYYQAIFNITQIIFAYRQGEIHTRLYLDKTNNKLQEQYTKLMSYLQDPYERMVYSDQYKTIVNSLNTLFTSMIMPEVEISGFLTDNITKKKDVEPHELHVL
jgi:hypothetical protein